MPRDALECREQLGQRTPLGDVNGYAACIERDAPRAHDQNILFQLERADHHLGRADELTDADDGGVGQRGDWRYLQAFERLLPFLTGDRGGPECGEIVGEQHSRRFTQPEDAPLPLDVFEGHHQDARLICRGDAAGC